MKSIAAKSRIWTHKSVRILMREVENDDPQEIIRIKADAIIRNAKASGWKGPPFNPLQLVSLLGIRYKESRSLFSAEAQLTPVDGNQLLLEFNPDRPTGRKNFSIMHEIAHTFFNDCYEMVHHRYSDRLAFDPLKEVEDLCQLGGANLLMPEDDFRADLANLPFSLRIVPHLAHRYGASPEAVARRMIALSDRPVALVFMSKRLKPIEMKNQDSGVQFDPKMRVLYSVNSSEFPVFMPAHKSASDESCVYEVGVIDQFSSGTENWNIRGLGPCKIEAMGLPVVGNCDPTVPSIIALIEPVD